MMHSLILLQHVSVTIGNKKLLDNIACAVYPGELVGVIGMNGAGKTTLLKAAAGLLPMMNGEVQWMGRRETHGPRAKDVAYLPQGAECQWAMKVRDVVALGRLPHLATFQRMGAKDWALVEQAMAETDCLHLQGRDATTLSFGERSRVMLARALAGQPKLLLADEPNAGLDPAHQLHLMEMLREKTSQGLAVMASLHDLTLAARFCDRILLLANGKLVAAGVPGEVLTNEYLMQTLAIQTLFGEYNGQNFLVPWDRIMSATS